MARIYLWFQLCMLMATTNAVHLLAQSRLVTHITQSNGSFTTRLLLSNPQTTPVVFEFRGYNSEGTVLTTANGMVPGQSTSFQTVAQLFGRPDVSHFEILNNPDLTVTVLYQAKDQIQSGPAHVSETRQTAHTWQMFSGNPAVTWDGIALVNRGVAPANARILQRSPNGGVLAQSQPQEFSGIPVNGKRLAIVSALFEAQPDSIFEISADQPIALIALRGEAVESAFLWQNQALMLPNPPSVASGTSGQFDLPAATEFARPGFHEEILIRGKFEDDFNSAANQRLIVRLKDANRPNVTCDSDHPLSGCATVDWSDGDRGNGLPSGVFDNRLTLELTTGRRNYYLSEFLVLAGQPDDFDPG